MLHFRTQWKEGWRVLKTKEARRVAIPVETAALLPQPVHPSRPLWANKADPLRPMMPGTISNWIRRAVKGVGIADPENVDAHSLRRAFVRTAKRANIPNAVAMRVTGHRSELTYNGYDANSVDDTRPVVEAVHAARERAPANLHLTSTCEQSSTLVGQAVDCGPTSTRSSRSCRDWPRGRRASRGCRSGPLGTSSRGCRGR